MRRVNAAMPSVMQEYGSINWAEELKGYRTDYDYYPDYLHAPIHGVTDGYTNPQNCLAWDAAMDAIIPVGHNCQGGLYRTRLHSLRGGFVVHGGSQARLTEGYPNQGWHRNKRREKLHDFRQFL